MSSRPPPQPWNSRMRMGCDQSLQFEADELVSGNDYSRAQLAQTNASCDSPYSCGSPPPHRHLEVSVPSAAIMSLNVYQTDCINPVFVFGGPGHYSITHGMADLGHEHQLPQKPMGQPLIPPESQNIRNILAPLARFPTQAAPSENPRPTPAQFSFSNGQRPPASTPVRTVPEDRLGQPPLTSTASQSPIRPDPFHQRYLFGREIPSVPASAFRNVPTGRPHINDTTPPATPNRK